MDNMLEITVEDLMSLKASYEERVLYDDILDQIAPSLNFNSPDGFQHPDVTVYNMMHDYCFDDRSRTVEVVLYKGTPCVYLQRLGRGDYETMDVLHVTAYSKLLKLLFEHVLQSALKDVRIVDRVTIDTYGAGYAVSNNTLYTSDSSDKLKELYDKGQAEAKELED